MVAFSKKYLPLMGFQVILMVLFFVFCIYSQGGEKSAKLKGFEDVHVMIFIGFGFLMTFLKKYCYSALGFSWLIAALVIQWALLVQSFFHMKNGKIIITKTVLLEADIMAATILITFGAVLGLVSVLQLLVIAIIETAVGCVNLWLITEKLKAADVGGSIAIHAFGAYFGLALSAALKIKKTDPAADELNGPTYISDITAMLGSIFLWIYWPSFNAGLTTSDLQYEMATVNTYLSLASCAVTTFFLSSALSHAPGKFDMVHIQNSTLAGGVAVGSICNMYITPGGAILIGMGAAALSVCGFKFLTPKLIKMGIQDTCGVHNLHGMPGVYSGILSIYVAARATEKGYGKAGYNSIFVATKSGRSMGTQALYQLVALAATIGIAVVSGYITGLICKMKPFVLDSAHQYNDEIHWVIPGTESESAGPQPRSSKVGAEQNVA